jgi:hypothetical protein
MEGARFLGFRLAELILVGILIGLNLALGFGCGVPLARLLGKVNEKPERVRRYYALLIGVYFVEAVALMMGMGIPVLSVGMAFVWGIVLGVWLRERVSVRHDLRPAREALRASFFFSLYSSLPAVSFMILPVLFMIGGDNILSVAAGRRLGIPEFVPWPLNTILFFYDLPAIGAMILKAVITTGIVSVMIHLGRKSPTESADCVT